MPIRVSFRRKASPPNALEATEERLKQFAERSIIVQRDTSVTVGLPVYEMVFNGVRLDWDYSRSDLERRLPYVRANRVALLVELVAKAKENGLVVTLPQT